jgi:site-specific recombinase XerD
MHHHCRIISGSASQLVLMAHLSSLQGRAALFLRHTFASPYLEANPDDLRGLAALLGHASVGTVMIYTEPTAGQLLARMEKAERDSGR